MSGHDSLYGVPPNGAASTSTSFETRSPEETAALGELLGRLLEPGDVVLLQGELGAGKTCLTQGLARGLEINDQVCSPTFVLVGEYVGRLRLFHADLYRLDDPAEIADLDLSHASESGVLVVEWPERAPGLLPREHLLIRLEHDGDQSRRIEASAAGRRAEHLLRRLLEAPAPAV